jgi:hypothetical protein
VSDRLALANAIEDAGIMRDKAQRLASVIFDAIHDNVATKADVQALGAELRTEIVATRSDIAGVRAELKSDIMGGRALLASEVGRLDTRIERLDATVKVQPNAIMLRLGTLMVVLTGTVLVALRYWAPGHSG